MGARKQSYNVKRSIMVHEFADLMGKRPYEVIAEFLAINIRINASHPLTDTDLRAYSVRRGVKIIIVE